LTKLHEEAVRATLPELAEIFRSRGAGRGEITVVVEGGSAGAFKGDPASLEAEIRSALERGESKRGLARELARRSGRPARQIYARAVEIEAEEQ
jgi:16S rRNA (cytidine1402-2'-O)-methyltransferase